MTKFERIKDYYIAGLWSKNRVYHAVEKEWITPEEKEEIFNSLTSQEI